MHQDKLNTDLRQRSNNDDNDKLWLLFLSHIRCKLFHSPPFPRSSCCNKTVKDANPAPQIPQPATAALYAVNSQYPTHSTTYDTLHRHYGQICTSVHYWKIKIRPMALIFHFEPLYRTPHILCVCHARHQPWSKIKSKDGQVHVCHLATPQLC